MERGEGNLLSDDFLSLGEEGQTEIYGQIIDIANDLAKLRFSDWGNIRDDAAYNTFTEFVRAMFDNYCERILERRLVQKAPLEKIREYFLENIHVFDDEKKSSFIHTDLNIANVLHLGDKVTLLFDFDSSMKGPRLMLLPKLISSIDNLGEIFDGTQYRRRYCYRKFENLYPVLRNKMKDVFDDPNLVKKLNLVLILRGIRLIAKNRYEDWNSQILRDILVYELVPKGASFRRTYYGHILKKMGLSY